MKKNLIKLAILAACFLPWMTACVVVNAPDKGEDLCVCGLYEQENAFPAALDFYVSPAKDDLNLKWETLRFAPSWKNLDKALFLAYAYDFDKGYMYHYYCHVQKKM